MGHRRILLVALVAGSAGLLGSCDKFFGIKTVPPIDALELPPPGEWLAVTGGLQHTCGIKVDQTLWCWGRNDQGQLGDPDPDLPVESDVPQLVAGSGWTQLAARDNHTCGLRSDNSLWCWGDNPHGSLGTGDLVAAMQPVQITGSWSAISMGSTHTCAIDDHGALKCWGANDAGQLGTGADAADQMTPMLVDAGPWIATAAGSDSTCGIKMDRTLWCWGANDYGQVGLSGVNPVRVPARIGDGDPDPSHDAWSRVVVGLRFACAIRDDHRLRCWGSNGFGQLGDDSTTGRNLPTSVDHDQLKDWVDVAVGSFHACGRQGDGTLWCWGANNFNQLALETQPLTFRSIPVQVGTGSWDGLGVGAGHTCAIDTEHHYLSCAGLGGLGTLGDGSGSHRTPTLVIAASATPATVSVGYHTTCAIVSGAISCWGYNERGAIGNGSVFDGKSPIAIGVAGWHSIGVGDHTCAVNDVGELWCWGNNDRGAVGDGTVQQRNIPIQIVVPGVVWQTVAASTHTCALSTAGALYCWGPNSNGECGQPSVTSTIVSPFPVGGRWQAVAAGISNTCAVDETSLIQCFGSGSLGSLGDGSGVDRSYPALVSLPSGQFTNIAAGYLFACTAGDPMYCWGYNDHGQFGDQTTNSSAVPVMVPGAWRQVATGASHACAIKADNTLWCFGRNNFGQLGDGTLVEHHSPMLVGTDADWATVTAGEGHTCATKLDNSVWCWGANDRGEIGDGSAWRSELVVIR